MKISKLEITDSRIIKHISNFSNYINFEQLEKGSYKLLSYIVCVLLKTAQAMEILKYTGMLKLLFKIQYWCN